MFRLVDLLEGLEYKVAAGNINREVNGLCYSTHDMLVNSVFVCIKGFHSDSHDMAQQAVYGGATVIVAERGVTVTGNVTVILVSDSREALSIISSNYFGKPAKDMIMIGVTGTKGKTTTVYMIADILEAAGISTGIIGSIEIRYNNKSVKNENTTPESYIIQQTLSRMKRTGVKAVVMEVSSQGLKLKRVHGITFDYGVFTNISRDHIGEKEHADMEEYISYKAQLFKNCRCGIYNIDDERHCDIIDGNGCERLIHYGIEDAGEIKLLYVDGIPGVSFTVNDMNITLRLPGCYSVYNALAAIKVCGEILCEDELSTRMCLMAEVLYNFRVKGRTEVKRLGCGAYAVVDYAHNALALESLLESMREYVHGRLVCLFGCGGNRSRLRRLEMGEISAHLADFTVITSDNPRYEKPYSIMEDIEKGVLRVLKKDDKVKDGLWNYDDGKYAMIEDRKDAVEIALSKLAENDMIVIAGKGHENYQEIRGRRYYLDDRDLIDMYEFNRKQ